MPPKPMRLHLLAALTNPCIGKECPNVGMRPQGRTTELRGSIQIRRNPWGAGLALRFINSAMEQDNLLGIDEEDSAPSFGTVEESKPQRDCWRSYGNLTTCSVVFHQLDHAHSLKYRRLPSGDVRLLLAGRYNDQIVSTPELQISTALDRAGGSSRKTIGELEVPTLRPMYGKN